ncbi:Fe-S cluster assembly ATPase SufC [Nitratifractor salsuginis]|uniref:Iron-regulated ABC transporter ATPase subunit SufC n=1 Tax=Nitratifractor salsuginis (strain DSM 16511 / JCM 12458 / E9I37-1) TaxID=749222 RepID=E6WYY9_NITSE|nr:Fe-S cluster assembly ATPase SufC [Nitratifractor salsuginis]ADV46575.1 Iron-regulated ABC transporter ATPase subunit SufC [Nitratifractor salsuginis DSM 16511]
MSNVVMNIENLHARIGEKEILKGLNLQMEEGKVHAIMGPNGAGKSTLSKAITGHYDVEVTDGAINYKGQDIVDWEPEDRALEGIFLSFQNPVEIPGVNNAYFLRTAVNAKRKHLGLPELNAAEFLREMKRLVTELGMKPEMINRSLNEGFSGGEKKRNEILQMMMLQPDLIILDEIDSGLDIDALRAVSEGINKMKDGKRSFLVITHYSRILDYIEPDYIHVLKDGRIVKTAGPELVAELEEKGYGAIEEA